MEPTENQKIALNVPEAPPNGRESGTGRIPRRRFRSLFRRRPPDVPEPSIVKVMAEWAEYQIIFNDILGRLSSQFARQAKVEKQRLERIADAMPSERPVAPVQMSTKAALRTQYAMSRFGGRIEGLIRAKDTQDERIGQTSEG